jgi:hypothetical protein
MINVKSVKQRRKSKKKRRTKGSKLKLRPLCLRKNV